MQKFGPDLLIPVIYDKKFSPNEFVKNYSLHQLIGQLDNLFDFEDFFNDLEQIDHSDLITRINYLPESEQLLDPNDLKKSLLALLQRIINLYICVVRSLSILKALFIYKEKEVPNMLHESSSANSCK